MSAMHKGAKVANTLWTTKNFQTGNAEEVIEVPPTIIVGVQRISRLRGKLAAFTWIRRSAAKYPICQRVQSASLLIHLRSKPYQTR